MEDITEVKNFLVNITDLQNDSYYFLKNKDLWTKDNQLCFLNTKGHKPDLLEGIGNNLISKYPMSGLQENLFVNFNPNYKNSLFYWIYKNFPLPITRMRLMRVLPKTSYTMHVDGPGEIRYHIAIFTNPHAYIIYEDPPTLFNVPANGKAYRINVEKNHTAANFNFNKTRLHLVLNAVR